MFGFEMSSNAHHVLVIDKRDWIPAILSGANFSIISKAFQLFGSAIELLAYKVDPYVAHKMLQMRLEDNGMISARCLPYSSSELLIGETATLVVPAQHIMIRKWSRTTPKGYPPESQLHLSNEYLENAIDNSLVITKEYPSLAYANGQTLIVNNNSPLINFNKGWCYDRDNRLRSKDAVYSQRGRVWPYLNKQNASDEVLSVLE